MNNMKRVLMVLLALLVLAGCIHHEEEKEMKRIEYSGNTCAFNLDFADGTGFEWMVLYTSDNLTVKEIKGKVERTDPTSTGGRGYTHVECEIDGGKEAVIVLKYGRPWENEGDYHTYHITIDDNAITDVQEKIDLLYTDFVSEYEFRGEDYLSLFIYKDWEFELTDDEDKVVFKLKPAEEESWISVSHTAKETEGSALKYGQRDFILGEGFIYRADGILCETSEAPWAEDRLLEILELLDLVSYE